MKTNEYFKPPFRSDGALIYDANGTLAVMAANCYHYPRELMKRIVELLNGISKPNGNPPIGTNGLEICINGDAVMIVRGYAYLRDAIGLSEDEADKAQEAFAEWIVDVLRGDND